MAGARVRGSNCGGVFGKKTEGLTGGLDWIVGLENEKARVFLQNARRTVSLPLFSDETDGGSAHGADQRLEPGTWRARAEAAATAVGGGRC